MDDAAQDFTSLIAGDLAGLGAVVMAGLGDRLGLFKALAGRPAGSHELSRRAGIDERYAREWLRGMCAAGYLKRLTGEIYELPADAQPALADEDGPAFLGGTLAMTLEMLNILPELESAFRSGSGIGYDRYRPGVFSGFERDMAPVYRNRLVQEWLPAAPELQRALETGIEAVDVGTGAGLVPVVLARAFPRSRFYGYDIHAPSLERARQNAIDAGVGDRVVYELVDPTEGLPRSFDMVSTFDVIHDAARPARLMRSIRLALPPGGFYFCMEQKVPTLERQGRPLEATRYAFSLLYCMSTSLGAGGEGWGALGADVETFSRTGLAAGFSSVDVLPIDDGMFEVFVARP